LKGEPGAGTLPRNVSAAPEARIAVVGDVHLHWGSDDVAYFDASDYHLVCFVGDLAGYTQKGGDVVARSIASMRVPSLVLPGNHDGVHVLQLASEVFPQLAGLRGVLSRGQEQRRERLSEGLGSSTLVGYSSHRLCLGGVDLNLVAARPHSMGGPHLGFARFLERAYGVRTMEESAERLRALVDGCDDAPLVFLGHNGPAGLGDRRDDIWGCDFRKAEGDWGDEDLRQAVAHARSAGRKVLAVVAGHMHQRLRGGGHRTWHLVREGVLYVNAARVPRVFPEGGVVRRHHLRVVTDGREITIREVLAAPASGGGGSVPPPPAAPRGESPSA